MISRLGARAGLGRRISPHDLRHGNATAFAEQGTPLEVTQDHLGHKSPLTTRVYIHTKEAARRAAVDLLGARAARVLRATRHHPKTKTPGAPRQGLKFRT